MKTSKILFIFVILILVSFVLTSQDVCGAKMKIGIMNFKVSKNLDPAFGTFLYDAFMDQMVQSGKFTVVDWEEIDRVLQYIAKSQPNISQEAARKQAINQLGIQKMYIGSLTKVGSKYYISLKVLNLDLSVDRTTRGSVDSEDNLEQCIMYLAKVLLAEPEEAKRLKAKVEAEAEEQKLRLKGVRRLPVTGALSHTAKVL